MKMILIICASCAVIYGVALAIATFSNAKKTQKPFLNHLAKFTVSGHRGASVEAPGNTMDAFRLCHEIDPGSLFECDVWESSDGVVMISHDGDLSICTNGKGNIGDFPLGELKKLDAGYNISFDGGAIYPFRGKGYVLATLEELLAAYPRKLLSIDIKYHAPVFAKKVVALVQKYHAEEYVVIGSFSDSVLSMIRREYPSLCSSFGVHDVIVFMLLQKIGLARLYAPAGDVIMVSEFSNTNYPEDSHGAHRQGFRIITERFIRDAHGMGVPVFAWTINRADNMKRLYGWGIDGIVTDNPRLLKQTVPGNN
ncbi:MAG: glycerophosphodiester phosphodiesterase [Spirochaetes bacterium]|nr:MAG: glycerophosphodiester phosphodiesterase [Spirochaetota bacterium]